MEDSKKSNTKAYLTYAICSLIIAGYAGAYYWLGYQGLPASTLAVVKAAMYLAVPALAAFTAFVAWIFAERTYKRSMFFLAVATVLMVSGETVWIAQSLAKAGAVAARTGLGDYLISGGYLFLWALLLSMARFKNLRFQTNLRRLVDVYLYLLFTALLVWNINFRYVFLKISSFTNLANIIVAVAPILILALVFGVAANTVGFKRGRWRPWDVLIALGVSSLIAASVGFTYLSVRGAYSPANPVTALPDIGWMAGYFMFFLAGASYLMADDKSIHKVDEVREPRLFSMPRELLIYISILGSILLFLPLAFMDNPAAYDNWVILVCTVMLVLLVILRAFLYVSSTNKLVLTSLVDLLTCVNNYQYLQTKLDAELSRAMRYNETLSIALIDLYKFSEVNKTRGHAMGDAILKSFAKVLRTYLRLPDSVCRIGGDEFAIILPQTGLDGAETVCNRIKETLKDKNHSAVSVFLNGVSCGISSYPDHGEDRQTLLDNAEIALKWAESHGRDQVAVFNAKKMGQIGQSGDVAENGS
ncbi:MAG: GGDEF domain-containing protein [Actinomycetota bacterium]